MSIYDDRDIPEEGGKSDEKVIVEPRIKSGSAFVQADLVLDGCGKVISVGNAVTAVKPGDEVLFDPLAGQSITLFGKLLKILHESEVTLADMKET